MNDEIHEILMVEDSANDAELTMGALYEYNFASRVVLARDGAEALDYFYRRGLFAGSSPANAVLVLLDMKMPKVNGIEVLRQMKSDPELAYIPVVMLSSSREEIDLKEAHRLGVNAYVVKPVRFQDFVEAVKTIGEFWCSLNVLPSGRRQNPPEAEREKGGSAV